MVLKMNNEQIFESSFNRLPPSVNDYVKPSVGWRNDAGGQKAYAYMYETKNSKDFKKIFREHLFREILNKNWDKNITAEGHWILDLEFVQSNTGEDSSNYIKILLDAMTGYIYDDDKNIMPRINRVTYNKKSPRFSFSLKRSETRGVFDNEEDRNKLINNQCISCRFYRDGKCSILKDLTIGKEKEEYSATDNYCNKYIKKKGLK